MNKTDKLGGERDPQEPNRRTELPSGQKHGHSPTNLLRKGSPSRTNFVESNPHRDRSRGLPLYLVAERGPICSFSRFTRQYWVG